MKLIVGLGNPGEKYQKTLHNAGFMALDFLADRLGLGPFTNKYKGLFLTAKEGTRNFALLKPQTYMNLSGESVRAAMDFYKIEPSEVLVLSDDMDLPLGTLRYRKKGGHGGHNGLRNIIQHLGDQNFPRLKIGVGRPDGKKSVTSHVLGTPHATDQETLEFACKESGDFILNFIRGEEIQIPPKA